MINPQEEQITQDAPRERSSRRAAGLWWLEFDIHWILSANLPFPPTVAARSEFTLRTKMSLGSECTGQDNLFIFLLLLEGKSA